MPKSESIQYLNTKIERIRENFDDGTDHAFVYENQPSGTKSFSGFTPLSKETIRKLILQQKSKTS